MIQHIVAFCPLPNVANELEQVMQGLAGLVGKVPGFTDFVHGPNIDAEGKTPDYPFGFIATFDNRAALDRYAADPRHQALGGRLVALCEGGAEAITVFDIQVSGPSA